MSSSVLVVEDEFLIALDMEDMVSAAGYEVAGLASSMDHALDFASRCDIALVDVNLSDGRTGPALAERLANEHGVRVVMVSGNPELVADGLAGVIGVLPKPVKPALVAATLDYARRLGEPTAPPAPRGLLVFPQLRRDAA